MFLLLLTTSAWPSLQHSCNVGPAFKPSPVYHCIIPSPQLCAKFLVEEPDEETMKAELKEAFRVYDRDGAGFITTDQLRDESKIPRRL